MKNRDQSLIKTVTGQGSKRNEKLGASLLLLNDYKVYLAAEIRLDQLINSPILFYSNFDQTLLHLEELPCKATKHQDGKITSWTKQSLSLSIRCFWRWMRRGWDIILLLTSHTMLNQINYQEKSDNCWNVKGMIIFHLFHWLQIVPFLGSRKFERRKTLAAESHWVRMTGVVTQAGRQRNKAPLSNHCDGPPA